MVLVWRIADNLPNSPNFHPAKLSRYTVFVPGVYASLQRSEIENKKEEEEEEEKNDMHLRIILLKRNTL